MAFEIKLVETTDGTRVSAHDDTLRRLTEQLVLAVETVKERLLRLIDQAEKERL